MDLNSPMYLAFADSGHFQGFGGDSQLLGLSLQEMIDTDIKADFDDITCGNNFSNMESLELLNDIDFKFEEGMLGSSSSSNGWSSSRSGLYESTLSSSYLEDMTGATSVMVDPISVMPLHHHHPQQQQHQQQQLVVRTQSSIATPTMSQQLVTQSPVIVTHLNGITTNSATLSRGGIKTLKILPPVSSPLQQVPSPSGSLGGPPTPTTTGLSVKKKPSSNLLSGKDNGFPKPAYSYSCLIALALKNSQTGSMSVSEIYKFMCEHFPYFKTAPSGWKNSVRHNLSLNKCFEKIEKPTTNGNQRKGCLWAMNPAKISKMDEEVAKWSRKDPAGIKKGMLMPETLESLERGELVKDYSNGNNGAESEDDDDPRTPTSVSSQGSQGYDSAGSDFVDVEGFTAIPDSSLPELSLQASGGIFEEFESATSASSFFHANYSVVPATVSMSANDGKPFNTLILHKQEGHKIFSI